MLCAEGGGDAAVWKSKLWTKAEGGESKSPNEDDYRHSKAWGTGSCKSTGIPGIDELYKERPKSKAKTPRAK